MHRFVPSPVDARIREFLASGDSAELRHSRSAARWSGSAIPSRELLQRLRDQLGMRDHREVARRDLDRLDAEPHARRVP